MKTIERVPVVQQAVNHISDYILSGELEVGQKLPSEKALCEMLLVGRSTVREAIRVLQASGLVVVKPGRGAFVSRTKLPDSTELVEWFLQNEVELRDCIEVRSAIEPLSIKLAIARATDEDIESIARIHRKFVRAVEENDSVLIAKYDERFHNQIVAISKNQLLISINRKVNEFIKSFRSKTFLLPQNARNAVEPHADIMRALQSRDSEAGELYVRRHIQKILEDMNMMMQK